MASRGRGAVVNIIGMGGKVATPIHLPGGAANSALMLATVGLASVYGPKGIRINAINPGAVLGERLEAALTLESARTGATRDEVLAASQKRVPLGRYADPDRHRAGRAVPGFRASGLCDRRGGFRWMAG